MSDAEREAGIFMRYLLGRAPSARAVQLYCAAAANATTEPGARDERLVRFALARPWSTPLLDAALALVRPSSLLRQKILLAAAVLESLPDYAGEFLPRQRSSADAIAMGGVLLRAACAAGAGLALLQLLQ